MTHPSAIWETNSTMYRIRSVQMMCRTIWLHANATLSEISRPNSIVRSSSARKIWAAITVQKKIAFQSTTVRHAYQFTKMSPVSVVPRKFVVGLIFIGDQFFKYAKINIELQHRPKRDRLFATVLSWRQRLSFGWEIWTVVAFVLRMHVHGGLW